jgi:thioredoxin 1
MANVHEVSDTTFDAEVLQSATPVLIDFWAPWCAPCRAIAPVVEELAGEYAGKLKVVKINVDDNPQTPSKYGVRGIPNLLIIQGGEVKDQIVGAVAKKRLVDAIAQVV